MIAELVFSFGFIKCGCMIITICTVINVFIFSFLFAFLLLSFFTAKYLPMLEESILKCQFHYQQMKIFRKFFIKLFTA